MALRQQGKYSEAAFFIYFRFTPTRINPKKAVKTRNVETYSCLHPTQPNPKKPLHSY